MQNKLLEAWIVLRVKEDFSNKVPIDTKKYMRELHEFLSGLEDAEYRRGWSDGYATADYDNVQEMNMGY